MAIEKVDLSGGMSLEETAPVAGASGGKQSAGFANASQEGEELVRSDVHEGDHEKDDDDGNDNHSDNNSGNENDENRPPHRVDRLA